MKLRLKKTTSKVYNKLANYLVSYDHSSGSRNRYTVFLLTSGDPVVIGRELDLPVVRGVIKDYEAYFKNKPYYGDRRAALAALKADKKPLLDRIALKGPKADKKIAAQLTRVRVHVI